MFENVDGRRTDGRTTDAGVTGILIAHLGAFGSGELKMNNCLLWSSYVAWFSEISLTFFVQYTFRVAYG